MRFGSGLNKLVFLAIACAENSNGQLPIAAKAGLIYLAEGEVSIDGHTLRGLSIGTMARVGEGHVFRNPDGRAELLLQPLNFIRLAAGAKVEMLSDTLTNVRVRIDGSAIGDITRSESVAVVCADAIINLLKSGVYRFHCDANTEQPWVRVYKGAVIVTLDKAKRRVAEGYDALLKPEIAVVHCNSRQMDDFDDWSYERTLRIRKIMGPEKRFQAEVVPTLTDPEAIRRALSPVQ
jgi:hypothetical protein